MEDPPGFRLELHNGEVVKVTRPKQLHLKLQKRMMGIFDKALGSRGDACIEVPFRPSPEHELRVADVAWTSSERYENIDEDDNLQGAPEIVVEILSRSNTASDMVVKRELCLSRGCEEFWIVDPKKRFIEVTRSSGLTHVYRGDDRIPIGRADYSVDEILGGRQ